MREVLELALSRYELIIVNDGSKDNTFEILQREKESCSHIRIFSHSSNMGKGCAVRTGILESLASKVIILDGDLDIHPNMIKNYIEEVRNSDLVIASKVHELSKVNAPIFRKILSRVFNFIVRIGTGIKLKDTQAGLKAGNGNTLRVIFKIMQVKRYAFDVELLTIAHILNLGVKELPIEVNLGRRFKVSEMGRMFFDVAAISYRYRVKRWYHKQLETLETSDEILLKNCMFKQTSR